MCPRPAGVRDRTPQLRWQLWCSATIDWASRDETPTNPWRSHRETVGHPTVGPIAIDCDSWQLPDSDQTVMVNSAEEGTPELVAPAIFRAIGPQEMSSRR